MSFAVAASPANRYDERTAKAGHCKKYSVEVFKKEEIKMTGELIAASVCGLIVVSETIYCVMDLMKHSKKDNRR